jgi:hypothetical protein
MLASLENKEQMMSLMKDVDAVVHMGGVSTEQPWDPILASNIVGMVNLYEAARLQGTKRIVFASSNHVTGFYRQDEVVNTKMPPKPDGFYGLSKAFGEDLAELYWARWGIETVSLRIGSSYVEPKDRRMLATWLSFDDLERLVVSALTAPIVPIHADVMRENVLVNYHSLSLIDFDDSGWGFALYDLGTVLSQNLYEPAYPQIRDALMEGYGTSDRAMVEIFTLARTCASVGWTMPRLAPGDPVHPRHLARACMWAEKMFALYG